MRSYEGEAKGERFIKRDEAERQILPTTTNVFLSPHHPWLNTLNVKELELEYCLSEAAGITVFLERVKQDTIPPD